MKKILLIITILSLFILSSCGKEENINNGNNTNITITNEVKSEQNNKKNELNSLYKQFGEGSYKEFLSLNNGVISAIDNNDNIVYLNSSGDKIVNFYIDGVKLEEFGKSSNNLGLISYDNKGETKINYVDNLGNILFGKKDDISTWGNKVDFGKNIISFNHGGKYYTYNILDDNGNKILDSNFLMRRLGGDYYIINDYKLGYYYIININTLQKYKTGKGEPYLGMNDNYLIYSNLYSDAVYGINKNGEKVILVGKDLVDGASRSCNLKEFSNVLFNLRDPNGDFRVTDSILSKRDFNKICLKKYGFKDGFENIYNFENKKLILANGKEYEVYTDPKIPNYIIINAKDRLQGNKFLISESGGNDLIKYIKPEIDNLLFIKQYYKDLGNGQLVDIYNKSSWESGYKDYNTFMGWYKGIKDIEVLKIDEIGYNTYKIDVNLFYEGKEEPEFISSYKRVIDKNYEVILETLNLK